MNFTSYYLRHANKTLDWLPMDTKELYQKNAKLKFNLLEKNKWINTPVRYKFNSLGFRCNEFTGNDSIMFLGCSNTLGIGLPIESTWATIVSKNLNLECANLAIGGSSPDTAFRFCYGYINQIKPKILVYLEPPPGRLEIVRKNNAHNNLLPSSTTDKLYQDWILDETNIFLNYEKNLIGIRELCRINNCKFLYFKFEFFLSFHEPDDYARDLSHLGRLTNQNFAKHVISSL